MTAFIEFSDELVSTAQIGTIWKKNDIGNDTYGDTYLICIGEISMREGLEPSEPFIEEGFATRAEREERYEDLKHQLRVPV